MLTHQPVIAYWKVLRWSEDFWSQFCEQQRLIHEGVMPDPGLVKTAKEWSITVVELQHLLLEAGLVLEESDRRNKLATKFVSLAEIACEVALDKFQDDAEIKDMQLRHTASMARTFSDAALNLKNGSAAPTFNFNMTDVRAVIALNQAMPEAFVPLVLPNQQRDTDKDHSGREQRPTGHGRNEAQNGEDQSQDDQDKERTHTEESNGESKTDAQ